MLHMKWCNKSVQFISFSYYELCVLRHVHKSAAGFAASVIQCFESVMNHCWRLLHIVMVRDCKCVCEVPSVSSENLLQANMQQREADSTYVKNVEPLFTLFAQNFNWLMENCLDFNPDVWAEFFWLLSKVEAVLGFSGRNESHLMWTQQKKKRKKVGVAVCPCGQHRQGVTPIEA